MRFTIDDKNQTTLIDFLSGQTTRKALKRKTNSEYSIKAQIYD